MGYKVINLMDIYNAIGEEKTKEVLSQFKCELNKDVEYFLKEKAIEFSKKDISRTFIVMSQYKEEDVIVGYFAISSKDTTIRKHMLSKSKRRIFSRYSQHSEVSNVYTLTLPLIGQLGKNYNNEYDKLISGDVLLKFALDKIKKIQHLMGGRFVFLECEDNEKVKTFYESNGFVCYDKRNLEKDELDKNSGKYLLQMLKDLSKYEI